MRCKRIQICNSNLTENFELWWKVFRFTEKRRTWKVFVWARSQTKTKNTFYQQIFKLSTEPTCSKYMIKEMKCSKHLYQKCIMINFFSVLLKWPFDFGNISMCYIIIGQTSRHTMLGICVQLARLNICLCIIPCLHICDVPFAHSSLIVECVL